MIARIISGGQSGVDIAALRAAKHLGIPTGGWMPKGWRTLDGPRPEYAALYGMREAATKDYPTRTRLNVTDAHATLILAKDFTSPGEVLTRRFVRELDREYRGMQWVRDDLWTQPWDMVTDWLSSLGPSLVLNVAGNSEQTAPGIEAAAYELLVRVLGEVNK